MKPEAITIPVEMIHVGPDARRQEWNGHADAALRVTSALGFREGKDLAVHLACEVADALLAQADKRFPASQPGAPVLLSVVTPAPPVPYKEGDR